MVEFLVTNQERTDDEPAAESFKPWKGDLRSE
jgi:hypothetical protein